MLFQPWEENLHSIYTVFDCLHLLEVKNYSSVIIYTKLFLNLSISYVEKTECLRMVIYVML